MSNFPTKNLRLNLSFIALFLHLSCSTDTDFLSEVLLSDSSNALLEIKVIAAKNESVVIDITGEGVNGEVTDVSEPDNGTANINPDNTITYTPDSDVEGTDEFEYTVTNPSSPNPVVTGTVTVTITDQNKFLPTTGDQVYYVTTAGKSSNNGRTEASSWNLSHAFKMAKAGDVVHVKAGNYGAVNVVVNNSGTATNPIIFIGYKNSPGDIQSTNSSTYSYNDYKVRGNNINPTLMPTLQGSRTNSIGFDKGITIAGKNYITIENFMIRHYEHGIHARGNGLILKNIISTDHGDFDPKRSWPTATEDMFLNLFGTCIWVTDSDNVEISNILVVNGGARGIAMISTTNSRLANSKVYSNNNINATDYYILLYDSHKNIVEGNYVERVGMLSHFGHGICLKTNSSYNTVKNNSTYNTGFETNNNVHHNNFTDNHIEGTGTAHSGGYESGNGSNNNTYTRCSVNKGEGIVFADWIEVDGANGITNAGNNNTYIDCLVTNPASHNGASVDFMWNAQVGRLTSSAFNNTFIGCTFEGGSHLFKVDRINSGNKFIDCTIKDVPKLRFSRFPINESLPLGVSFENTTTINIGFSLP